MGSFRKLCMLLLQYYKPLPMLQATHYIPFVSTIVSFVFTYILFQHWLKRKSSLYLFWWMFGVLVYGLGTLAESINTIFGWNEINFKFWFIVGALMGGAPLAQGTVYLLLPRKLAHLLTFLLVSATVAASYYVVISPINIEVVTNRLTGDALVYKDFIRSNFSRNLNLYAVFFLIGGAIYSAVKYSSTKEGYSRMVGNIYIAFGAILPGFGGYMTRLGYVEVLYVTELIGISLILIGYYTIKNDRGPSLHQAQVKAELNR